MSVMVTELYDALRRAGVDEQLARSAATAVLPNATRADLVTNAELRIATAELKADLIKWNVGAMVVLTAICAAIVRLG